MSLSSAGLRRLLGSAIAVLGLGGSCGAVAPPASLDPELVKKDYQETSVSLAAGEAARVQLLYFTISLKPHLLDGVLVGQRVSITYREPGHHRDFVWVNERLISAEPSDPIDSGTYVVVNGTRFRYRLCVKSVRVGTEEHVETQVLLLCNRLEQELRYHELFRQGLPALAITGKQTTVTVTTEGKHTAELESGWKAIGILSVLYKAGKALAGKINLLVFVGGLLADQIEGMIGDEAIRGLGRKTTCVHVESSGPYSVRCLACRKSFVLERIVDGDYITCPECKSRVRAILR